MTPETASDLRCFLCSGGSPQICARPFARRHFPTALGVCPGICHPLLTSAIEAHDTDNRDLIRQPMQTQPTVAWLGRAAVRSPARVVVHGVSWAGGGPARAHLSGRRTPTARCRSACSPGPRRAAVRSARFPTSPQSRTPWGSRPTSPRRRSGLLPGRRRLTAPYHLAWVTQGVWLLRAVSSSTAARGCSAQTRYRCR